MVVIVFLSSLVLKSRDVWGFPSSCGLGYCSLTPSITNVREGAKKKSVGIYGITHMFGGEGGWCMRIFELFAASLFPFSMPRIFVSFLFGVINHDQVSLEGRAKKWMALLSIRIHLVIPVLPKDHTRIPERRAMIHSNNTFVPRRNRNNLE